MDKIATKKIDKLKLKKQLNDEKIIEFQEKIKFLQTENNKIDRQIQDEENKQILNMLNEHNISLKELNELVKSKKLNNINNNINNNNHNNINNNNHNHNSNNFNNQERSFTP